MRRHGVLRRAHCPDVHVVDVRDSGQAREALAHGGLLDALGNGLQSQAKRLAQQAVPEGIEQPAVRECLADLPGVSDVHDVHVWAMSTSENAMTAHLVVPGRHPGDEFLRSTAALLEERFGIHHATLQIEIADTSKACAFAPDHVV